MEVEFRIKKANTAWGEHVCISGNIDYLGKWNPQRA